MDPNVQTQTINPQPVNPVLQQPPVQPPVVSPKPQSQPVSGGSKKRLKIGLVLLVLVILGVVGFFAYSYFNTPKTYNAGVYDYPTQAQAKITVTPTPSGVVNPNDTTDSGIDSDNKVIDQQLNNLNSDMTGVDQSLNDKQTNLQ